VERNEVLDITSGETYSWAPVWSPDGRRLAFYLWHDRSIAVGVWTFEDKKLSVLRAPNLRGRGLMQWHPSGRWLVCPIRRLPWGTRTKPYDPGRLVNAIESSTEPQPYDAVQIEARASGLIAIEVETGRARTIVAPDLVNLVFALSPNGREVATLSSVDKESPGTGLESRLPGGKGSA
jgi:hypothetical protein